MPQAFAPVSHLTVGDFRNWLLSEARRPPPALTALAPGLTPEMVAAVSKIMRNQDLVSVAQQVQRGHALSRHHRPARPPGSVRLQPNHPTDDLRGVAASTLDGLLLRRGRCGDRPQPGLRQHAGAWPNCCACSTR